MPDDDAFLGATSFNKIHAPGNGPFDDDTLQREQTFYWMARQLGVPWNYRRYVNMYINGAARVNVNGTGLMEDTQVPDGDVIKEHFPTDKDGDLFKLQPWFEFDANGKGFSNNSWCMLNEYLTTGGAKKMARYRWNYLVRRNQFGANNYTNVYNLVDAANNPANSPAFISSMENLFDTEEWLRAFAASHSVGDWDHVGTQNAQNMYAYKPTQGKWTLLPWDCNIVLGNGSWDPGQNLFSYTGGDQGMANIYNTPVYARALWRAYKEIATSIMDPTRIDPVMDAKYASFVADGINVNSPSAVEGWITSARSSILSQLATASANAAFTVNAPGSFSTNQNEITISGTAPVEVKTIMVNGIAYPITWNDIITWNLKLALSTGVNTLAIQGYDIHGNVVTNAARTVTINYTGTAESPQGHVIINEIMFNPVLPGASFIEIYNTSTINAFDLSGYRLNGIGFVFPGGSIIQPNGFLVVASDAAGFAAAYGNSIPLAGVFNGKLSNGGETLKLIKPGVAPAQDTVVNEVTYDSAPPWPTAANGFGPSLQLIDPTQDNNRVANWAAVTTNAPTGPQWQYVTLTGIATKSALLIGMTTAGDVYIDDLKLVAGTVPEAGPNYLQNGDFESPLSGTWNVSTNVANSAISTTVKHSGNASLHVIATSGGPTITQAIWQNSATLVTNATYTLSYWYLPSTNGSSLLIRLSGSSPNSGHIYSLQNFQPQPSTSSMFTPGAMNSVRATG
ncbi:MAG: hypothetical protein DME22_25430 [Verrucomicrobia bacterium]|nr:MAG: hypothetical protein DME22_25430 [Verrucomicrobiota bacterium]